MTTAFPKDFDPNYKSPLFGAFRNRPSDTSISIDDDQVGAGNAAAKAYNPDQPRAENGEFGSGGYTPEDWQMAPGSSQSRACKTATAWQDDHCTGVVPSAIEGLATLDARGVNDLEETALSEYSDMGYKATNEMMRNGQLEAGGDDGTIDAIQSAIDKNTIDQEATVFRGITSTAAIGAVKKMDIGSTFTDRAFVSTSLVRSVGQGFATTKSGKGGMEIHISVPAGSHAVGLAGGEGELLFGANSTFRLDGLDTTGPKPIARMTYVGADPYNTGKLTKAARRAPGAGGKFEWDEGDFIINSKAKKAEGIVWKSADFGKERIVWKSTVRTHTVKVRFVKKAPRINWKDHPDHAVHKAIVDHYVPKLAAAMRDSVDGINPTIADAQRRYALVTKAVGDPSPAQAAANAAIRANLTLKQQETVAVLRQIIADSTLAASHSAAAQIGAGATMLQGLDRFAAEIDWDAWKPGWAEAADLARAGGLQRLLEAVDVTIKYMDETSLERIGTALANGLAAGSPVTEMANNMLAVVSANMTGPDGAFDPNLLAPPARAFLIAETETSRAMSAATADTYAQNDIEQWEWLAQTDEDGGPDDRVCEICLDRDGETYDVGGDDLLPPQHPRCRCVMLPVVVLPPPESPEDGATPDDGTEPDEGAEQLAEA